MNISKLVISPNECLFMDHLRVAFEGVSTASYTNVIANMTFFVDSAYNNIPINLIENRILDDILEGSTTAFDFDIEKLDVSHISEEIQMNMGLLELQITGTDNTGAKCVIVDLKSVTQVSKRVSGGPLFRTFYSPL